jgi:CTP:molybdopterin cytidylyltransferase MocA
LDSMKPENTEQTRFLMTLSDNPGVDSSFLRKLMHEFEGIDASRICAVNTKITSGEESFCQPPLIFDSSFAQTLLETLKEDQNQSLEKVKPILDASARKIQKQIVSIPFPTSIDWIDLDETHNLGSTWRIS